jgi:hypothetical protein
MARIRTIKPEFFTSADILALTPLARLFYVSLWCESDREGRLKWDLETFGFRYLPKEHSQIKDVAQELISRELVILYEVEAKTYAFLPSFASHQIINNRESASIIPSRVPDASPRVKAEGRKEGKEGKGTSVADFEIFWDTYPKKKSKGDAEKAWSQLCPDEQTLQLILQALQIARRGEAWLKDSGQFIPYPATWLRDKGWLDEIAPRLASAGGVVDPRFKGAK